jgi:GT2 family glycosyltransferase
MTSAGSDVWPTVYFSILNWNQKDLTCECLDSLAQLDYPNYEIVVVDNGSRDDEAAVIRSRFPSAIVLKNERNVGFAEGNNVAIRYALEQGADYVLLLNNDTALDPQMLKKLIEVSESDDQIAIVGPKIPYFDEPQTIWSAGGILGPREGPIMLGLDETDEGQHDTLTEVDWVTGCALLIKSSVVRQIGLIDARFFIYFEENDWCSRAKKAGFKIFCVPEARMWHKIQPRHQALSPRHVYLMTRNRLLFLRNSGARLPLILFVIFTENFRAVCAWSIRKRHKDKRPLRGAVLRGVFDFMRGRFGEPPADL